MAAVCLEDDYQNAIMGSHWAKVGDTVKLRYVEEYESVGTFVIFFNLLASYIRNVL